MERWFSISLTPNEDVAGGVRVRKGRFERLDLSRSYEDVLFRSFGYYVNDENSETKGQKNRNNRKKI